MKKRGWMKNVMFGFVILAVVAFSVIKPVSLYMQIRDLKTESKKLQEAIDHKKIVNNDLKKSLAEGITDESIAKIARDVLGYASPGERVFIDSSEQ